MTTSPVEPKWKSGNSIGESPLVRIPLIGGAAGFAYYIVMALLIEAFNPVPKGTVVLSYGQQSGLISLPFCSLIGAGIGLAIAIARTRQLLISVALLLVIAKFGNSTILGLWNSQIAQYGHDRRSELVLYYPPMAMCGAAFALAIVLFAVCIVRIVWPPTMRPER